MLGSSSERLVKPPAAFVQVDASVLDRVTHELLDDEGVAAAGVGDQPQHRWVGVDAKDVAQHERDVVVAKGNQRKLLAQALACQFVAQLMQARAPRLLGPVGEYEQDGGIPSGSGELADQRMTRRIGPVEVLENEHEPGGSGACPQIASGSLEQHSPVHFGSRVAGQLGKEQLRKRRRQRVVRDGIDGGCAALGTQGVLNDAEWQSGLHRACAALDDDAPQRAGAIGDCPRESGLAEARLTGQGDDPALGGGGVKGVSKALENLVASHDRLSEQ